MNTKQELRNKVTTVSPMKRGLKELVHLRHPIGLPSYNRYPDEKGTESLFNPPIPPCQGGITTAIPMKRGLKGNFAPLSILALMSSRLQSLQPFPR